MIGECNDNNNNNNIFISIFCTVCTYKPANTLKNKNLKKR